METALFHNFTDKPFTGYWNGKAKTFQAGEKKYMPAYLAEHYAKHLTNQVLIENGDVTSTSPKKPSEVPKFMELFNKACIIDTDTKDNDESELEMDIANRPVNSKPRNQSPVDNKPPQIIKPNVEDVDDDEESFEGLHDPSSMSEGVNN